jgi:hypothetical protein
MRKTPLYPIDKRRILPEDIKHPASINKSMSQRHYWVEAFLPFPLGRYRNIDNDLELQYFAMSPPFCARKRPADGP